MKKIILLGATGSIGRQTLQIIREHPDLFEVTALSFGKNIELGKKIIREFNPKAVCVENKKDCDVLKSEFPGIKWYFGLEGLREIAVFQEGEIVLTAIIGSIGLLPTIDAIEAGKTIALANKETLVTAGHIVIEAAQKKNVAVLPIDSEHSAIFQALNGEKSDQVKKLILTASGGSFRDKTRAELKDVTIEEALAHPNWAMGNKLTIDSATMFNKGLEVIEAHWLYDVPYEKIDVVMHRESIIHSMVEYIDGSLIAQLGPPDMRVPIQYALTYPERVNLQFTEPFDITKIGTLHFEEIDYERFKALKLAFEAGKIGGTMPTVLNAANEIAVRSFLNGQIAFYNIEALVENALNHHQFIKEPSLEMILEVDQVTRAYVKTLL